MAAGHHGTRRDDSGAIRTVLHPGRSPWIILIWVAVFVLWMAVGLDDIARQGLLGDWTPLGYSDPADFEWIRGLDSTFDNLRFRDFLISEIHFGFGHESPFGTAPEPSPCVRLENADRLILS